MSGRIVVDELQKWPTKIACFKAGSCHLMVERDERGQLDFDALHAFAASIGMRREWFQVGKLHIDTSHYDLTASRRTLAIRLGAVFVPARDQVRVRQAARLLT